MSKKPALAAPQVIDLATWWTRNTAVVPPIGRFLQRGIRARRLKKILPIIAIVMVIAVAVWPLLQMRLVTSTITEALTPELAMLDLDFTGTDRNGRPFNVIAEKAVRQSPGPITRQSGQQIGTVALDAPQAALQQDSGETMNLSAKTGVYDEAKQGLTLDGTVQLGNSTGIKVLAPDMAVDLKEGRAWTDKPVTATGNFGQIDGQGLRLEDGGKRIIFTGKSRAVLNGAMPAADQTDTSPETEQPAPQAQ